MIRKGEATGVVTSTGAHTYFGKTTQLVQLAKPKLHMETVISGLMKWLLILVVVLLAIAFAVSWIRGINLLVMLSLALILLVSAIPVALPTMFTVTMALGSQELVKKGVLVTRLSASEDAALMDVLCVDKTGTLTLNMLKIADVIEINNFTKDDVVLFGALASQKANQDSIDMAFLAAAQEKNLPLNDYTQKEFTPFDPTTRRTEAAVREKWTRTTRHQRRGGSTSADVWNHRERTCRFRYKNGSFREQRIPNYRSRRKSTRGENATRRFSSAL